MKPSRPQRSDSWGLLVKVSFATAAVFIVSAVLFDGWPFNALMDSGATMPTTRGLPRRPPKPKLDENKLLKMAQEAIAKGSPAKALDILEAALKIEGTVKGQEDMKRLVEDAKRRHKATPAYKANIGDVHKEEELRQKALQKITALNAEAAKVEAG